MNQNIFDEEDMQNQGEDGNLDKYQQIPAAYFESLSGDELSRRLKVFILDLLQHDFHRLCNLIYRHDVPESKFNEALSGPDIEVQAEAIAQLVIEREMQKIASRKAYREYKSREKKQTGDKDLNE